MHLAQGRQHDEVEHRAGFEVDRVIAPTKAPAPGGHRFLKRQRKVIGCREVLLDVFCADDLLALLKAQFEKFLVHLSIPFALCLQGWSGDHAIRIECVNLVVAVAQLREDLARVLADGGGLGAIIARNEGRQAGDIRHRPRIIGTGLLQP